MRGDEVKIEGNRVAVPDYRVKDGERVFRISDIRMMTYDDELAWICLRDYGEFIGVPTGIAKQIEKVWMELP